MEGPERDGAPGRQFGEAAYVRKSASDLWNNLPTLLGANLLCLLISTPYLALLALGLYLPSLLIAPLTVAPAWVGLLSCAGKLARGVAAHPLEALRGVRRGYWRSGVLGLLTVALLGASQLTYHLVATVPEAWPLALPLVVQLSLLLLLVLLHVHSFALVAMYDASVVVALRNAFVLAVAYPLPTLGLISLALLLSYTLALIGPGMALVVPIVLAVFFANNTLVLVERRRGPERSGELAGDERA